MMVKIFKTQGTYQFGSILNQNCKLLKTTQSKQFSLEDMKKAIEMARVGFKEYPNNSFKAISNYIKDETNRIIQSLSTQQLPKEFIPEYEVVKSLRNRLAPEGLGFGWEEKLKIITNSEGKQELVGTYKY